MDSRATPQTRATSVHVWPLFKKMDRMWFGGRVKSCVTRLLLFALPFRMTVAPSGCSRALCGELCLNHEVFRFSQIMLSSCRREQSPAAAAGYAMLSPRNILVLRAGWLGGWASWEERRVGEIIRRHGGMMPLSPSCSSFKYSIKSSSCSSVLSVPRQRCDNTWCNSVDTR